MRLALAQINTTVGDLDGNRDRIVRRIAEARDAGAELVVFPELAVTGYPPEDLLLRPAFVRAAARRPARSQPRPESRRSSVRRSPKTAALQRVLRPRDGAIAASTASGYCRTTASSTRSGTSAGNGGRSRSARPALGPTVCEDLWQPGPPAVDSAAAGADSRQPLRVTLPRRQGRGA